MTDGDGSLTSDFGDHLGEVEVLDLLRLLPRREPPQFAVVPVVGEPKLRSDEEDLLVEHDDAAVVDDILVDDGPGKERKSGSGRAKWSEQRISHIPTSTSMS